MTALAVLGLVSMAFAVVPPVYITQWGILGSGPGQFNDPAGVAVDGAGNVYVTDTNNNRVQKFDANGVFLTQWGTAGSGPGQFSGPFGIAARGSNVYVVDTGNYRVQVFTLNGAYVTQWGGFGTGSGTFTQPLCVAVDLFNTVYVTDYNLNLVQAFSNTGTFYFQWGGTGSGNGQFNGAAGITGDNAYQIFVTDSGNHRVQIFSSSGTYVGQWGVSGAGNGQFQYPFGITSENNEMYVADTFNQRMQQFTNAGGYETQWGSSGTGNGQFTYPHSASAKFGFIYVADTENNRIQKFGPAPLETCATCFSPPDTCCEGVPRVGGPWTNVLVGTRQPAPFAGWPYCVTIFNLNSSPPTEDVNWTPLTRYNGPGPGWTGDSLGTVFGLTLDKSGNIFVCHTACYSGDQVGQVFGAAPGAIYRIDGTTGAINTFCVLPNLSDANFTPPEDFPGLGNITYDCRHDQFFVTNMEDGKIYRIKPTGTTGTVVEVFDPLAPDNGQPGFAPVGERLWGIQWHGDRVFYSVYASDPFVQTGPNEIRSVALLPSGAFATGTDQHELFLPPLPGNNWSNPVADISFSSSGRMLLGERGIQQGTYTYPHASRVLEFVCSAGCWVPGNSYLIGDYGAQTNASGGVDYDRHAFSGSGPIGRLWATGDAIHLGGSYPDYVYGYQGMRPNVNGSNVNSDLVDSDGNVASGDKTFVGDIEAPGCPVTDFGSLCGTKFLDSNHNGVKDAGEPGLSGWTIQLLGPGGPYTATTDANGNYCFTNIVSGAYTVAEIGQSPYVQTAPAGGTYSVNLSGGQTLYSLDFGNYVGGGGTTPCVDPPTGMAAWWPFNEPVSSTTAADVAHPSPAYNVAQLSGGAAITAGGFVKRSLCFPNEVALAKVPYANQLGLNFGTGNFSIDVWVNAQNVSSTPRVIVEKRHLNSLSPYKTLGWALTLNGLQTFLEIGVGPTTQTIPGPTIPPNTWTHIAVTVSRSPAAGIWYLNGVPATSFNFAPIAGTVSNAEDLYMGHASPPFGTGALAGCIDELEIFGSVLSPNSIQKIYQSGQTGKCPEYCRIPEITTICKDKTTVQVCFNICNTQPTAQSYHWSLAGLPVGPGCTVSGPTVFSPPSGTVTVPPGSCSAPICVTITRPAGLTAQNATSCFALNFVNDATGVIHGCTGAIRADNSCWCMTPIQTGIVTVGRAAPTGISIGVGHGPCDPTSIPYRIVAVWTGTDHEDPQAVRLNGLPPGEPVIGTLSLAPGQDQGTIMVDVDYPYGYDGFAPYDIVLEADTDGDGVMERQCATMVSSGYDGQVDVAVPVVPRYTDSVRLLASPNPFFGGVQVDFTLARPDKVDLAIYDLSGRLVRALKRGTLEAGIHRFEWNGRTDRGEPAAAGVYFVRLSSERLLLRTRMVKLR